MPTWQQLVIPTDALITALVDRGILPAATTRVNVWGGNQLGVSYIKVTIANDAFEDMPVPAPVSPVDVAAAIEALGL